MALKKLITFFLIFCPENYFFFFPRSADQPLPQPDWRTLELPEGVRQGRYFLYRA